MPAILRRDGTRLENGDICAFTDKSGRYIFIIGVNEDGFSILNKDRAQDLAPYTEYIGGNLRTTCLKVMDHGNTDTLFPVKER